MTELEQERIRQLLRKAMPRISGEGDAEMRRDLWPAMQERLAAPPAGVPWIDWALLAALAIWLIFFPGAIPVILYHL